MKATAITLFLFAFFNAGSPWLLDINSAMYQANSEDKLVLLYFSGSDWCKPCIQLKTYVLETDEFKNFADGRFVLVQADFPRLKKNRLSPEQVAHNEILAEKYNPKGEFPLIVVMDKNGRAMFKTTYQHQSCADFISQLDQIEYPK